jgi:predicted aspartyl protease
MLHSALPLIALLFQQPATITPIAPEIVGGYLYVDAVVNGVKGRFVVDTGASVCTIEPEFAAKVKPKVLQKIPVGGVGSKKVEADYGMLQQIAVGDQSATNVEMVVLQVPSVLECDGLIGYTFLRNLTLKVDYAKGSIEFLGKHSRPGGNEIKMIGGLPSVSASLLNQSGWMTIDTGASGTTFFESFVKKHELRDKFPKRISSVTGQGVGGFANGEYVRIGGFKVGGHSIPEFDGSFSNMKQGVFATDEKIGNLGSDVFRRFVLTIDFPNQKIFLDPNEEFDKENFSNGTGIAFDFIDGKCKIVYIRPKSAAESAGLFMGETILQVNGQKVSEMRRMKLRELFAQKPGTEIEIMVERKSGKVETKKIILKGLFQ